MKKKLTEEKILFLFEANVATLSLKSSGSIYNADVIVNGHSNTMTIMASSLPYIPLLNSVRELA